MQGRSNGWFTGIKCCIVKITGEAASANIEAMKVYTAEFEAIVQNGKYPEDLIFSINKTGLYWKGMLSKTFSVIEEKLVQRFKAVMAKLLLIHEVMFHKL